MLYLYSLILVLFITPLNSGNEKSSKEIQNTIDNKNNELQSLKIERKRIEEKILQKNKQEIDNYQSLIDLEHKINLTEKIIVQIEKDENRAINDIFLIENKINNNKNVLIKLKNQITKRLQYLYIYGHSTMLETILLTKNWNNIIYRIKYLEELSKYEKELRKRMQIIIENLDLQKLRLIDEKNKQQKLLNEKKLEGEKLEEDKSRRVVLKEKIKKEQSKLKKEVDSTIKLISKMENLIKELYANKKEMKKREEELARIRAQQNKSTTGNFAKMKGRLTWPIKGKITKSFGTIKEPGSSVITVNNGIDISANEGVLVKSVLDGVVSTIDVIPNYGNIIIIDHGGGYSTVYAKVNNIKVNINDYVQIHSTIASVANLNNNSNLHFEIWENQKAQNPINWLIKID